LKHDEVFCGGLYHIHVASDAVPEDLCRHLRAARKEFENLPCGIVNNHTPLSYAGKILRGEFYLQKIILPVAVWRKKARRVRDAEFRRGVIDDETLAKGNRLIPARVIGSVKHRIDSVIELSAILTRSVKRHHLLETLAP